ncbi:hypothetical protein BB558_005300 [Smittium angustum]|uniref:Glycoside hydrolase family 19 catalytic domain-containing protein n=1 Tax=Smittium angustum TaxID=133377 RepID=A0A2U1J0V0_SMIAN|nr:hypothetical protein BB558_007039 [Smittium angustum]PVZ98689.1 hypothetical protein BB558_005300 [Smittium angustum]
MIYITAVLALLPVFSCRYIPYQNTLKDKQLVDISGLDCSVINEAFSAAGYNSIQESMCSRFINGLKEHGIDDMEEAAAMMSELIWESQGLEKNREDLCLAEDCSNIYSSSEDVEGKDYGGRGYIQLTWAENYRMASQDLYGDDRLLEDPDMVLEEDISWDVSFWYWMKFVHEGFLQNKGFGTATNMINGALECRGEYKDKAKKRYEIYKKILQAFDTNAEPNEEGCY